MARLTKSETAVMLFAALRGEYRPTSKENLDACIKLAAHGIMQEQDNAPGTYYLTRVGEARLEKMQA